MRTIIALALLINPILCLSQEFQRSINKTDSATFVSFLDLRTPPRVPIILKKYIAAHSNEIRYEIGLFLRVDLVPNDFFMQSGGMLVFENGVTIKLKENVFLNFLSGGRHQVSIKHYLSMTELEIIQKNKLDYFIIGEYKNDIDRFEKQFIMDFFLKMEKQ